MLFEEELPFIKEFVEEIDEKLREYKEGRGLSEIQKKWLSFCIMAIAITNSINWAKFERVSLKKYSYQALSWMFRHSKIDWENLLRTSVKVILRKYGIKKGFLVADDTDKARSKVTKRIPDVYKMRDKRSSGYIMGQTIVILLLVTEEITLPVGFSFYRPDPKLKAWEKEDKKLKKAGEAKKNRPQKPQRDEVYPTKQEILVRLIAKFRIEHPEITIRMLVADSVYGKAEFCEQARALFGNLQIISQIHSNQKVRFNNKPIGVKEYFKIYGGVYQEIKIRGGVTIKANISSARVYVEAHKQKRFVVAIKYEEEKEYRYLFATDMSWRAIDIAQGYTLRWLAEVFIEDFKMNQGWGQLTKQMDVEGSSRSLILSLLLDHCLLYHPHQQAFIENKLPASTVGSLLEKIRLDSFLAFIGSLLSSGELEQKLQLLTDSLSDIFSLSPSKKHMAGRNLGRLEPSASLFRRARLAQLPI
jgi:hypothetical protein